MDSSAFDALSRRLGASLTRQGLLRVVLSLSVSGLAGLAGRDLSSAKNNNNHNHNRRRRRNKANNCPEDKKNAVCHCPPGLGGAACKINCVGTGGGHDNDPFDCMCTGRIKGVPDCEPGSGRCPEDLDDNEPCGGPTTCAGSCTRDGECPFGSVLGCRCNLASGQCEIPVTCTGACATQEVCTAKGPGCGCNKLQGQLVGTCGAPQTCPATCTSDANCPAMPNCLCQTLVAMCGGCIPDGGDAGREEECCSGQYCAIETPARCGPCTPPAICNPLACSDQTPCTIQSAGCICRTRDGLCGACIENRDPAGGPDECCSLEYCLQDGLCGGCPAQTCDGGCTTESECSQRGGATCHCVGGACQTAVAPIAPIVAGCPPGYTGNAQSPCDSSCPCRGGRRCHN
jgi:hypothetical protein